MLTKNVIKMKKIILTTAIMIACSWAFAQTSDSDNVGQGPYALAKVTAFLPSNVPNNTAGVLKATWTLENGSLFYSDPKTFTVSTNQEDVKHDFVCPSSYIPVKIHIYGQIGSMPNGWYVNVTETITSNPMYIYIQSYEWQRYVKDDAVPPGGNSTE